MATQLYAGQRVPAAITEGRVGTKSANTVSVSTQQNAAQGLIRARIADLSVELASAARKGDSSKLDDLRSELSKQRTALAALEGESAKLSPQSNSRRPARLHASSAGELVLGSASISQMLAL